MLRTHKALFVWKIKEESYGVRKTLQLCTRRPAGGRRIEDSTRTNMRWKSVDCTRCKRLKSIYNQIPREPKNAH